MLFRSNDNFGFAEKKLRHNPIKLTCGENAQQVFNFKFIFNGGAFTFNLQKVLFKEE